MRTVLPTPGGGAMGLMTAEPSAKRPYRSERRRQQAEETRALVLAAATALFGEDGWSATGMRDIATRAGVSVETVYATFRSKSELLLAAIDLGVVGDSEAVPLSERAEFAALAGGDRADRVKAAARLVTGINSRTSGLRRALAEAAGSDRLLAVKLEDLLTRQRDDVREGLALIVDRTVDDEVADALWVVLDAEAFDLVTRVGGRSVDDYEQWLAATIRRLLERP